MPPRDDKRRPPEGPLDYLPDRRVRNREVLQRAELRERSREALERTNRREENRAILKKVNRVSSGRRKAGLDGIKIAVIMVGMMAVIAGVLIYIGNLDLSNIGARTEAADYNDEAVLDPTPPPIDDDFGDTTPVMVPEIDEDMFFYHYNGGVLELPIVGATGWAATASPLREEASASGTQIMSLAPGTGFTIMDYRGYWWYVRLPDETTGWVDNRRCFINLPDVLPSIIYRISNATESLFRSGGYALPGVTGQQMYSAWAFNYRLGRYEYIVPGMYAMARALHVAQQAAWAEGFTLVIYESFRPRSTQMATVDAMRVLMRENPSVASAINDSAFSLSWFISTGISNHQRAAAVDTSLARVHETEILQTGEFSFFRVADSTEIPTGTRLHELSPASSIVNTPRSVTPADVQGGTVDMAGPGMTGGIIRMQWFFASAGFHPLASEWWHFNHQPSVQIATASDIRGDFYTETIYSQPPVRS